MSNVFELNGTRRITGTPAVLSPELHAKLDSAEAERRSRITAAMEAAADAMQSPARRLTAHLTKNRARAYLRRPWELDAIFPDLSRRSPDYVLRIVEMEQMRVDRFVGFGGEVRPVNLRGAALVARYERRRERSSSYHIAAE